MLLIIISFKCILNVYLLIVLLKKVLKFEIWSFFHFPTPKKPLRTNFLPSLRVVKSKRTLHGCFAWEIPSICQNMPIMNSFSDKDSRILLMSLWVWQESWFLSMQYAKLFNKAVLDKIKVSRYYQKVALRSFSTFQ